MTRISARIFTGVSSCVDTNPGRYAIELSTEAECSAPHRDGPRMPTRGGGQRSGERAAPSAAALALAGTRVARTSRGSARAGAASEGRGRVGGQGPRRWTLGPRSYRPRARAVQAAGPASVLPPVARAPHRARDDGPPGVAVEPEPGVEAGAQTFGVVEGVHLDAVVGEPPPTLGCWIPAGACAHRARCCDAAEAACAHAARRGAATPDDPADKRSHRSEPRAGRRRESSYRGANRPGGAPRLVVGEAAVRRSGFSRDAERVWDRGQRTAGDGGKRYRSDGGLEAGVSELVCGTNRRSERIPTKNINYNNKLFSYMAEREGFEPSVRC